jgi:hypothetical protein
MINDIISKLRAELATPISSERQVVYILVELRKLLEIGGEKQKYRIPYIPLRLGSSSGYGSESARERDCQSIRQTTAGD